MNDLRIKESVRESSNRRVQYKNSYDETSMNWQTIEPNRGELTLASERQMNNHDFKIATTTRVINIWRN